MLRIVFVTQVWKFSAVVVTPANQEPLVASKSLAMKARESVGAVLERYGVGAGLGRGCFDGEWPLGI